MPFLTHAGVSLRYDRVGAGPAVLLIHGWAFNRTVWERQVLALRDRHTVITVDLRGHGESSHPRTGYGIGAVATDLEHLVRALNLPRVALVGWSMGGLVAVDLARRLGERVSALGLVSSPAAGLADDDEEQTAAKDEIARARTAIDTDFRGFVRELAPRLFKQGADSPLLPWAIAQMQKTPAHVAAALFDAALAADFRPLLKALHAPTAIFHGRHDGMTPLAIAEELKKSIEGATLTVFEESAHAPFLEEPDAFNAALAQLVDGEQARPQPAPSRRAARSAPSAPSGRGRPRTSR